MERTTKSLTVQVERSLLDVGISPLPARVQQSQAIVVRSADVIADLPLRTLEEINALAVRTEVIGPGSQGVRSEIADLVLKGTHNARLQARELMGNLMWTVQRNVYESNGITRAEWHTQRDSRVRREHRELEGEIFEIAKGAGPKHLRPGVPRWCRCFSTPVR